jgi:hypothetical protein
MISENLLDLPTGYSDKISPFIRFFLLFVKRRYDFVIYSYNSQKEVQYKILFGKVYVLRVFIYHHKYRGGFRCRHKIFNIES